MAQTVETSAYNVGDPSLIPGLGRSAGERKGYSLQHSDLENFMNCTGHRVTELDKSERLSLSFRLQTSVVSRSHLDF